MTICNVLEQTQLTRLYNGSEPATVDWEFESPSESSGDSERICCRAKHSGISGTQAGWQNVLWLSKKIPAFSSNQYAVVTQLHVLN